MAYNLHDLKVSGLLVSKVISCRVEERIGEHSSLELEACLEESEYNLYEIPAYQPIEVTLDDSHGRVTLFSGVMTKISVTFLSGLQTVRIKGKSYSWLMDLTKNSRSFQDVSLTYEQLCSQILNHYPGSSLFYAGKARPIAKLLVQYQETDWEFLQRVMSLAGAAVTPYSRQAGICLYAGIPMFDVSQIEYEILAMEKDMESYYHKKANGYSVFAADYTRYRIKSDRLLTLFDTVTVSGHPLSVYSGSFDFTNQDMVCTYGLQPARGLFRAAVYPMQLIGVALIGKVAQAAGDKVQVALTMDEAWGNPAVCWFPYSTMSASPDGSGWYCMPEVGDDVRVYIPSKNEEEAIALSAVSGYGAPEGGQADRMGDPNSRYLRTRDGQELALTPGCMKLSCGDDLSSATISNDGTVTISALDQVLIKAEKNLTIHAEQTLTVEAEQTISLQSMKGGGVTLGQQLVQFTGTQVKFD